MMQDTSSILSRPSLLLSEIPPFGDRAPGLISKSTEGRRRTEDAADSKEKKGETENLGRNGRGKDGRLP